MSADISELAAYATHLDFAVERCEAQLSKAVQRGAMNVKRDSQSILASYSRRVYLKHYYRSIGYEMVSAFEAEIGPDSSKPQGKMGRGVEFGSVHTPPFAHLFPAADQEEPRFTTQVAGILTRSLR